MNFKQIRQKGAASYKKACMNYSLPKDGAKTPSVNTTGGTGGQDAYPITSTNNKHEAPNTPLASHTNSQPK